MTLDSLAITNFKNIPEASLSFSPNINALLGDNGMGKSNLLDAIYYLSFCRSFAGLSDSKLIHCGDNFTMLRGNYTRKGVAEEISFGFALGHRKSFKRQGKEYQRLSSHIGAFPAVLVSPADMDLITGPAEVRRKFIDLIIAQTDSVYLDALIRYNSALQQRNHLLRNNAGDHTLYEAIELTMDYAADIITRRRAAHLAGFAEIFTRHYRDIARTDETPEMLYAPSAGNPGEPLRDTLDRNRHRDQALGFTSAGPHRDDITLTLDTMPVRTTASQGQSKTFTIAMRMAQYEFLHAATGMRPLLLLDDIFDKLDASRVANIVEIVNRDIFGQIFITDTNRDHLDSIMGRTAADYRLWLVDSGKFSPINNETH